MHIRLLCFLFVAGTLSVGALAGDCSEAEQAKNRAENLLSEERQKLFILQKTHDVTIANLRHEISRLEKDLKSLQSQFTISDIFKLVSNKAADMYAAHVAYVTALAEEAKLIVMGLQKGNTTHLSSSVHQIYQTFSNSLKAFQSIFLAELDEHLPAVKNYASRVMNESSIFYQEHISNATWVTELTRHVQTANSELKTLLTTHIKTQPVLATLDDPVIVQVLSYMIMGAPLFLLLLSLLLWMATLVAPKVNPQAKSTKKSAKKSAKTTGVSGKVTPPTKTSPVKRPF